MGDFDNACRFKLARLRAALEKGKADLAKGRSIVLEDDKELREFFARLAQSPPDRDSRR